MKIYFKSYLNLSEEEKLTLLTLRNSPFVRRNMHYEHIIERTEHLHWLETLKTNKTCLYWAILLDDELIGAIDLTSIDLTKKFAEWGFFTDEKHLGFGSILEYLGMEHFFETLNFQTILACVFEKNRKVYHLHKDKFGYQEAHAYDYQEDDRKFYGLTLDKEVWLSRKRSIYLLLSKVYKFDKITWE